MLLYGMVAYRSSAEEILSHFGDNVVELLGKSETSKKSVVQSTLSNVEELLASYPPLEIGKQGHRPVGDFIKPKTASASMKLASAIRRIQKCGFEHYFAVTLDYFIAADPDSLKLCCDGTRQFNSEWTSFRCRNEEIVVFAFRDAQDAVLFRIHI